MKSNANGVPGEQLPPADVARKHEQSSTQGIQLWGT